MLLYFKIKNSRSFSETATLSMIADDTIDRLPQNIINANSKHILKTAVIYGANASGKSNLLKAFADGCIIVQNGISLERKQSTKNNTLYLPNKNHETNKSLPTCYTYGLLIDDIRYEYYFSNDASRIVEEKLLCYEEGKKYPTTLFKRIYLENKLENKYMWSKFHDDITGDKKEITDSTKITTSQQRLWLSETARVSKENGFKIIVVEKINSWFEDKVLYNINQENPGQVDLEPALLALALNKTLKKSFLKIFKLSGFNFADIKIEEKELEGNKRSIESYLVRKSTENGGKKDILYQLPGESSTGTNFFISWLLRFYYILTTNKLLIVDEFGNSMHPLLSEFMIKLIQETDTQAQFIFSTHYSELMSSNLFRNDQIWLTNTDENENSILEPLTNYEIPETVLLDKVYLQGLLNGVPYIQQDFETIKNIISENIKSPKNNVKARNKKNA